MNKELMDRLKKDLEKSGLASELKVRRIFQERKWSISGGAAYLDKDEGKSREIDIVAHHGASIKRRDKTVIYNGFRIYAEVKKSEKPWVVFKHYPSKHFDSCAWNNIIDYINLPCKPLHLAKSLQKHSLIKANGWEGTGIHEAFKKPDQPSRWYGAFLSAIKSATDYHEEYETEGEKESNDLYQNPTEITFNQPVVILDGVLVTAELTSDNDILIEAVNTAAFKFEYKTEHYNRSSYRVDVVTINGLQEYLELVEKRQASLNKAILDNAGI
ncbi:MAG TPA: hypothetical protein VIQ81_06690 [Gammaproteobacteria bacterium]